MKKYEYETPKFQPKIQAKLHSLSFLLGIGVLIYLTLLYVIVFSVNNILPRDLKISDEANNPDRFIAERAIHDLKSLTSMGPRVIGSYENENLAVTFLTNEINSIIQGSNANQTIELDVQKTTGAYLFVADRINVYDVNNIVVKIYGVYNNSSSILVNSHYDSVPSSPGGSDDGINVVAMLEILRKISKSPERTLHNIILLFNGAEEGGLQAAHAFITQHKWAHDCKAVINLEASGHGGKIILFQAGPNVPWLLKYYVSVPHPYGQVAGEEIFQSGAIPSDTDFRIFRDYGGLFGYDMAFSSNGYRYHTKYDDFEHIPNGSYQHVGDNTLYLVKKLANASELNGGIVFSSENAIYFDILGLFMIFYTANIAYILNYSIVAFSTVIFIVSLWTLKKKNSNSYIKYLLPATFIIVGGWILALVAVLIIALILDSVNHTMSWYANPWLLVVYFIPAVGLSGSLFPIANIMDIPSNIKCQILGHIVRLLLTILFLLGTIMQIRSMYILMIPILFNCLAFLIILCFKLQHTKRSWLYVYFGTLWIPTVITLYQILLFITLLIPISGRNTPNSNPELLLGIFTGCSTILATAPYVALTPLMNNLKYYFLCLGTIFLIFVIIIFTPLGFPYSGNSNSPAPQRHFLTHSKRVFYNESGLMKSDSGILLLNMDRNSPKMIESYVPEISNATSLNEDCQQYILCALPLSQTKMLQIIEYSTWIPFSEPNFNQELNFVVNSKEHVNATMIRYNVTVSGSDRLNIFLLPKENMTLFNLNFTEIGKEIDHNFGNELLVIRSTSRQNNNLTFSFDMQVPFNYNNSTVDVSVSAIYVHDKINVKTPSFSSLIQQFPSWADVIPDLGYYASYVI